MLRGITFSLLESDRGWFSSRIIQNSQCALRQIQILALNGGAGGSNLLCLLAGTHCWTAGTSFASKTYEFNWVEQVAGRRRPHPSQSRFGCVHELENELHCGCSSMMSVWRQPQLFLVVEKVTYHGGPIRRWHWRPCAYNGWKNVL